MEVMGQVIVFTFWVVVAVGVPLAGIILAGWFFIGIQKGIDRIDKRLAARRKAAETRQPLDAAADRWPGWEYASQARCDTPGLGKRQTPSTRP